MEEIELILEEAKDQMEKAVKHTKSELLKIRAGKATPSMLEGLMVAYYGNPTPISQVASITTPDARSIIIKPFEKGTIPDI
ncbi:MAG: ribosome recycling factor, partial [Marivirga sp.]